MCHADEDPSSTEASRPRKAQPAGRNDARRHFARSDFRYLSALGLWASFNFGLGAKTTYGQMFAVWIYAALPKSLMAILASVLLFANVNTESFDIRNPTGTNLAYYMPDAGAGLKVVLSFFDLFGLWALALLILGTSIVSRKSRGQAAAIVVGWWVLIMLVAAGFAAATS